MKKAAIISWVAALVLSLGLYNVAYGSLLDEWAQGYADGTALIDNPDYADLYSKSTDRNIVFEHVTETDTRITAYYTVSLIREGEPVLQHGVAMFVVEEGVITGVEYAQIDPAKFDMAVAGQAADIITTAGAISLAGAVEANPAVSAFIGNPAGAVAVIALKLWLPSYANSFDLIDCIEMRTGLGVLGWGAAAWNIGIIAGGGPVAALVLGLAAGFGMYDTIRKDAPVRCIPRLEPLEEAVD